mgnify:CR=1 FL=1
MLIGGLEKFSLIDYPHGVPSAVVFTIGCNFRCPFCHNAELVSGKGYSASSTLSFDDVVSFLEKRKGLLQAVVFSGGEPLLQSDLIDYIRMVKDLGYKVKLDTNGTMPDRLMSVIDLADYVAMDIKASPQHYSEACGVNVDLRKIKESVNIIKTRAKDYEFRTTVFKNFFPTDSDFIEMGKTLLDSGTKRYYLQQPHLEHVFDRSFPFELYSKEELEHYKTILEAWVGEVCLRT